MLLQEQKDFIKALVTRTDNKTITWAKSDAPLGFESTFRGNKFKVDKYFASVDGQSAACLNLAIFDNKNTLQSELIFCKGVDDQKEDYSLLNALYSKVEAATGTPVKPEAPFFASITQSLQGD